MTYAQYYDLIKLAVDSPTENDFIKLLGDGVALQRDDLKNIYFVASATIADLRKAAKMTQAALCERLLIPRRTLEDWESRVRKPPEYVRLMIADVLGLVTVNRSSGNDDCQL